MEHDPMCIRERAEAVNALPCYCDLIGRVREEQYGLQARTWEEGYAAGIQAARHAVAALSIVVNELGNEFVWRNKVLAAIDALGTQRHIDESGGQRDD